MSTLHVLMPPLAHIAGDSAFTRWLARGDRLPDSRDARIVALRERFRFPGDAFPVAALRHHCHADDAGTTAWLCADPAYVRGEAVGARLMACPVDDITAAEADGFAAALRPLFGDLGVPLAIDTPSAWCVRMADRAPRTEFVRPAHALGVDLIECLPGGDAGRKWRRLFNEAQIALHAHPLNAARTASGRLPVNALWFWGAGALPDRVESDLRVAAGVDDVLRGLAGIAGVTCVEPSHAALEAACRDGDALLDLAGPGQAEDMAAWPVHFRRWLGEARFDAIACTFATGERFRIRHAHRLRFWRRA
jgi:hypothetical protein